MSRIGRTLSFPCLNATQGKYNLACFVAPAKTIWKIVRVNTRDPDKETGYQRILSTSRVNAIVRYIDANNSIPNSILICLDSEARVFEKDGKSLITIPNREDAGWVIDGQHRLIGAHSAKEDIDLIVVAFIGLGLDEQIKQFVIINREAKGVPTSLYYDLLRHLPPNKSSTDIAKERAADIANDLKKREDSPFYQRIVITSPKKGELSLNNFVRKVSPLVTDRTGKFHAYTLSEQIAIIDNYYRGLENIFPESFQNSHLTFFKTLGFGAMINALPTVFDLTLKEFKAFRVEDVVKTLKKVEDFDLTLWDKMGTGTSAENQAGEDFRQELMGRHSDDYKESGSLILR